jgi:hypothetical protein
MQWETRKGWDVLLQAYLHEFTADEPVELHIMTKPFARGKEVSRIRFVRDLMAGTKLPA